ncbi:MAG: phage portal protein, partial [PVC group bacterium]|nr:phage portal protein [PVC group bacterium]
VLYNTELLSVEAPFHKILPYINALDFVLTGNANDIDKLADAILVLSKLLKDKDKEDMEDWKVLTGVTKDDRAEFLVKNMDPAFREYVSKLLIQEIHKHSHVMDWYSPDTGLTGDVSAKALITRLFDMEMFSNRIEMVYRMGAERRVELVAELLALTGTPEQPIKIEFNRLLPDDMIDKAVALNNITFIADEEKYRLLGLDPVEQAEKLDAQKEKNIEMFDTGIEVPEEETE